MDDARFWAKVDRRGPDECWPWKACSDRDGYGFFKVSGRMRRAHVVAWELVNGPMQEGMLGCHKCDNPSCCNPAHIFPGTVLDNAKDMVAKGRQAKGESHGLAIHPERRARGARHGMIVHPEARATGDRSGARLHPDRMPRGEGHGNAKLTTDSVSRIRSEHAAGASMHALAKEFNVSRKTVSNIVRRIGWRHVGLTTAEGEAR